MNYNVYSIAEDGTVELSIMQFPSKEVADHYRNFIVKKFGVILMIEAA